MLTRSELPDHPVVLAIRGSDGQQHVLTTERVRGGKIRMVCTCEAGRSSGWCTHQVELLCLRYDAVVERNDEAEFHFEDIVMGTPLADLADEVDVALAEYRTALSNLDAGRSSGFDGGELRRVAELATDLADAAIHLDTSLSRFKKKLATGLSMASGH